MARIPPADPSHPDLPPDLIASLEERRGGPLTALDRLLVHNESVARGWNALFGALSSDIALDFRIRELAVLRTAYLTSAQYPLFQHRRIARDAGLTEAEIEAVRDWRTAGNFDDRERAVLAYADAMTVNVQVPDDLFDAVREHFDNRQLVALTATIAAYNMVARFMEALELAPEAGSSV